MEKVVLDTSVVVKWFVEEESSEKALKFLEEYKNRKLKIVIPEIIVLELANALFFGGGFSGKLLEKALNAFYGLKIKPIPLERKIVQGARKYMDKFNIAIYDAIFIYLAEKEEVLLITADKKHHLRKISGFIRYL